MTIEASPALSTRYRQRYIGMLTESDVRDLRATAMRDGKPGY